MLPLCLACTWLVWGSTYLGIKYALLSFPPILLSGVRYLIAGLLMLVIVRWRREAWPSIRQLRNAALIGALMLTIGNGLVCLAEKTVASGATALIVSVTPVLAVLANQLFGKQARSSEWLGIALGVIGVALLNLDSGLAGDLTGVALVIIACISWAFASALIPRLDLPKGSMSVTVQMLAGGAASIPIAWLTGERLPDSYHPQALLSMAYLIVFGSMVAYTAYVWLLSHIRPALATSSCYVNPVVALLLGWLLMNEEISHALLAGMAMVLAGVATISIAHARRA